MSGADEVRWLDEREQSAWRAFLDMQSQLSARLNREMIESSGLSLADFSVLVHLSEHTDGRMRVLELARGLRWEKSRLSHQLTRMQQRGLVGRSYCDEDRRGAFIVLTDAGRSAVEAAAPPHVGAVRRYLFDGMSEQQVDTLHEIATATIERLGSGCGDRVEPCGTEAAAAGSAQALPEDCD